MTRHNQLSAINESAGLAHALDEGYTLPADWYTEAAVFAAEKETIFHRAWQYVGLTEQVRQPGDFFTCRVGDVPLIVLRDEAGNLRAFVNVCRHRGSQLVLDERGCRKSIQCHYHWPNFMLNIYPGPGNVSLNLILPSATSAPASSTRGSSS